MGVMSILFLVVCMLFLLFSENEEDINEHINEQKNQKKENRKNPERIPGFFSTKKDNI
jgi:hypothetical protein